MSTDTWDATMTNTTRETMGSYEPAIASGTPKMSGLASLFDDPAGKLRGQATEKLHGFVDSGKTQVTQTLDGIVAAAREIADKLQDGTFGPVGGIATEAADTLERWTHAVRDKSVQELMDDGQALVRRSPGIAVGIAVAAGFVVSRVLKAGNR